jgi:hypothetical protein
MLFIIPLVFESLISHKYFNSLLNTNNMEALLVVSVIIFFGFLFFNSNLKDVTNFDQNNF